MTTVEHRLATALSAADSDDAIIAAVPCARCGALRGELCRGVVSHVGRPLQRPHAVRRAAARTWRTTCRT